jgi:hypothetical protein
MQRKHLGEKVDLWEFNQTRRVKVNATAGLEASEGVNSASVSDGSIVKLPMAG